MVQKNEMSRKLDKIGVFRRFLAFFGDFGQFIKQHKQHA